MIERAFTGEEHGTWQLLFRAQEPAREAQIWETFSRGIGKLGFTAERIPDLREVNARLRELTGFAGVAVKGFEEIESFYDMLARRQFPIGYFIRDRGDLGYTPAPDVFHDLYGHLPFFIDADYAAFCQEFGERARRYKDQPEVLAQWERLFWFTIEFALLKTPAGPKVFGAGIASSFNECAYALGEGPEVLPFDPEVIRHQPFRIDEMQKRLFLLESPQQLYGCLADFDRGCVTSSPATFPPAH